MRPRLPLIAILLFLFCTLPVWAEYVNNYDGSLDGKYMARVRSPDGDVYRTPVTIDGDHAIIHFQNGQIRLRSCDFFWWSGINELEVTGRDNDSGRWKVTVDR